MIAGFDGASGRGGGLRVDRDPARVAVWGWGGWFDLRVVRGGAQELLRQLKVLEVGAVIIRPGMRHQKKVVVVVAVR